jgi:phosphatidylinositol 4-kinase B
MHVVELLDYCEGAALEGHWQLPFKQSKLPPLSPPPRPSITINKSNKQKDSGGRRLLPTIIGSITKGGARLLLNRASSADEHNSGDADGAGNRHQRRSHSHTKQHKHSNTMNSNNSTQIRGGSPPIFGSSPVATTPTTNMTTGLTLSPSRPSSPDGLAGGIYSSVFMDAGMEGLFLDDGGGSSMSDDGPVTPSGPSFSGGGGGGVLDLESSSEMGTPSPTHLQRHNSNNYTSVSSRLAMGSDTTSTTSRCSRPHIGNGLPLVHVTPLRSAVPPLEGLEDIEQQQQQQYGNDDDDSNKRIMTQSSSINIALDTSTAFPPFSPSNSPTKRRQTTFGATLDFVEALCTASSGLTAFRPEEREWALRKALQRINTELERASKSGMAVWFPMGRHNQRVVRLAWRESSLLNSTEKAPFTLLIEVLDEDAAQEAAEKTAAAIAAAAAAANNDDDDDGTGMLSSSVPIVPEFDAAALEAAAAGIPWVAHHHRRSASQETMTSSLAATVLSAVQGSSTAAAAGGLLRNPSQVSLLSSQLSENDIKLPPLPQQQQQQQQHHHLTSPAPTPTPTPPALSAPPSPAMFLNTAATSATQSPAGQSSSRKKLMLGGGTWIGGRSIRNNNSTATTTTTGNNTMISTSGVTASVSPFSAGQFQYDNNNSDNNKVPVDGLDAALAGLRGEAPLVTVRFEVVNDTPLAAVEEESSEATISVTEQSPTAIASALSSTPSDEGIGSGGGDNNTVGDNNTDNSNSSSSGKNPNLYQKLKATGSNIIMPARRAGSGSLGNAGGNAGGTATGIVSPAESKKRQQQQQQPEMMPICGHTGWACKLGFCKHCSGRRDKDNAAALPSGMSPVLGASPRQQQQQEQQRRLSISLNSPSSFSSQQQQQHNGPYVRVKFKVAGGIDLKLKSSPANQARYHHSRMPSTEAIARVAKEHRVPVPLDAQQQLAIRTPALPPLSRPPASSSPTKLNAQLKEGGEEEDVEKAIAMAEKAYGEPWEVRGTRVSSSSPHGRRPGWALRCVIVKSGDDCRQELLAMQMIRTLDEIFQEAALPLKMRPYEVLVTSSQTALIEMVPNAPSIHAIKAGAEPAGAVSLRAHMVDKHGGGDASSPAFQQAQRNFTESLAAYSLFTYLLAIKDRHNGNILLDDEGHLVHIDFGFMLSNSPGGVNFESAPFKLTREMLEVMDTGPDGTPSELFDYFKVLLIQGLLAVRKHSDRLCLLVEMMSGSGCACFKNKTAAVNGVKKRLHLAVSEAGVVDIVMGLISESMDSWRTRQYDFYQRCVNGIF